MLLNMARQDPEDVRDKLDLLKQHDLLPQHFDEPIDDESSSFQHFEPVVVASSDTTPGHTAEKNRHGDKQLLTVEKPKTQQRNCGDSLVSIESGRSSVRQKSVTNSSY